MPRDTLTKSQLLEFLDCVVLGNADHPQPYFDPLENENDAAQVLQALGVEYIPHVDLMLKAINITVKG
jgi:hypothetical protein